MSVNGESTVSSTMPKLLLQIKIHSLKLRISSKIALEITLTLLVDGVERHVEKCQPVYTNQETRIATLDHVLRVKVDDRTAKRRLIMKINATKDGQHKLVALHHLDLITKTTQTTKHNFDKCIDKDGYFECSLKLLSVKGLKSQASSIDNSFMTHGPITAREINA